MFDDIVKDTDQVPTLNTPNWENKYNDARKQIEDLADFIMTEFQDRIGETGSLGAVEEAIRLLKDYKNMAIPRLNLIIEKKKLEPKIRFRK
jgi:hypothetical protein